PQKNTQDAVVIILDKVQGIINLREQEIKELDNLIKSRFVELFGNMTLNPNRWEIISLGKVCDVRDGTHDSPKYYAMGYPLVTSKNVTSGKIDFSECSLICEEDYKKINERSKVDIGDILMPMIGTVGKPVIVDVNREFAIKNVALIKFYEDSKVTNIFVKALLQSDYFDLAVINKIRGGTQKFIALGDIRKLEICLPPMEVQEKFATYVNHIDKLKFLHKQTLSILHHRRFMDVKF
ncbi:MAG: restriction endonuclease subunit S, partial [Lachnospiraceae bacterium]|nr:restriction endonuclease subunit S [Lachnospiraceae bacterium]